MKANKVTVTIVVEALSIDTLNSLVLRALQQVRDEYESRMLQADDGDQVKGEP